MSEKKGASVNHTVCDSHGRINENINIIKILQENTKEDIQEIKDNFKEDIQEIKDNVRELRNDIKTYDAAKVSWKSYSVGITLVGMVFAGFGIERVNLDEHMKDFKKEVKEEIISIEEFSKVNRGLIEVIGKENKKKLKKEFENNE